MDGTISGVVVQDAGTGERLHEHNPGYRLMPASNVKMLTSAAAMELLGPDYTYTTTVLSDGQMRGNSGVMHGDLYLKGDGDPTLLAEDFDSLAAQVAGAGIRKVHGNLVADDTRFDSQRLGPLWSWGDEDFYYSAQISALSVGPNEDYDAGTIIIDTIPGASVGDAPEVAVIPESDYITIDNQATTTEAGGTTSLSITRERGSNTWTVSGTIAADADDFRVWRAVWEPTGKAAAVFAKALEDHGVQVHGDVRTGEPTPGEAELIAAHESMTLTELLNPFMKLSNNGHGEVLLKTIGDEVEGTGTWPTGAAVISDYLQTVGMTGETNLRDGSGLSRGNQIPAGEFASFLHQVQDADWFDDWYAQFPIACAGERMAGGTLNHRMCDTPAERNVYAKTGSLTGVTALSGYVTDADDRDLVFSLLFNNNMVGIQDIENEIAVTLASYSADAGELVAPRMTDIATESDQELECSWLKGADTTGPARACLLFPGSVGPHDHRQCDAAEVGGGVLVVSGGDSPPLFEPVHGPLDGVAQFVDLRVEIRWASAVGALGLATGYLVRALGDGVLDALGAQVRPGAGMGVGLVGQQAKVPPGPGGGHCLDQRGQHRVVTTLTRAGHGQHRGAGGIGQDVDLGRQPTAGTAQGMIRRFPGHEGRILVIRFCPLCPGADRRQRSPCGHRRRADGHAHWWNRSTKSPPPPGGPDPLPAAPRPASGRRCHRGTTACGVPTHSGTARTSPVGHAKANRCETAR